MTKYEAVANVAFGIVGIRLDAIGVVIWHFISRRRVRKGKATNV